MMNNEFGSLEISLSIELAVSFSREDNANYQDQEVLADLSFLAK